MSDILIHIGYHKTGTTWLQKHVFHNPAIGFVYPPREGLLQELVFPHALVFDSDTCRKHLEPIILEAIARGTIPVLSLERFSGNPHSGGYDSKELADRLVAVFPKAKVFMVIREQKDLILSTYKEYVRFGGVCSLPEYLQPPLRGRQRIPLFDWNYFQYHRLIRYYQHRFHHSKVLVLPYEFFREHPLDFVTQILAFCELDGQSEIIKTLPYLIWENPSLSGTSIVIKRLLNPIISPKNRLNPTVLFPVSAAMNHKLQSYWQALDSIIPRAVKRVSENKLKTIISKLVEDKYKQSNALTAKMLNINLEQYGYDL